jgi:hypothetical protein
MAKQDLFASLKFMANLPKPVRKFTASFTCPATGAEKKVIVCEECLESCDAERKAAGITARPTIGSAFMWAMCQHCGR